MPKIEPATRLEPEQVDPVAVGRVAAHVEFVEIRLVWANAALNAQPDRIPDDWAERSFIGYDTHADTWADDRNTFTVAGMFVAGYSSAWTDAENPPAYDPENPPEVDLSVMFELTYSVDEPGSVSDDDVEHFAVFNATFNAWPYWRELAQTATQRMRIPPLLVPVLKVPLLDYQQKDSPAPQA